MKKLCIAALLSSALVMSSCGGGGGAAGDATTMSTYPSSWALGDLPKCNVLYETNFKVTIVGGVGPFRIHNPVPDAVQTDVTEINGQDPVFTVTAVGGCEGTYSITVLDVHSQTAVFRITTGSQEVVTTTQ